MSDTIVSPAINTTADTTIIIPNPYNSFTYSAGLYGIDYIAQPVAVTPIISDDPATCPATGVITDENWCGT